MRIQVEIAPGELVDKLTILGIKLQNIKDPQKLTYIEKEWDVLNSSYLKLQAVLQDSSNYRSMADLDDLVQQLQCTNKQIWDIEDAIRDCERRRKFEEKFIDIARSVYITNDKRAAIKREINNLFDSDIAEQKSYTEYKTDTPNSRTNVETCSRLVKEHRDRNK